MKTLLNSATLKTLVAACAVSVTALSPLASSAAAAGDWRRGESSRNFYGSSVNCYWSHGERWCAPKKPPHYAYPRPIDRHDDTGAIVAGAILGIAGAAILSGALTQPAPPPPAYYVAPNAYPPAPAQSGPKVITYESTLEPWTRGWYDWCEDRYRSFNPQTGTYRGYDGRDHFCVPN